MGDMFDRQNAKQSAESDEAHAARGVRNLQDMFDRQNAKQSAESDEAHAARGVRNLQDMFDKQSAESDEAPAARGVTNLNAFLALRRNRTELANLSADEWRKLRSEARNLV